MSFNTQQKLQAVLNTSELKALKKLFQVYPSKNNPAAIDLGRALFVKDLNNNVAAFRTPTLRNLEYCNPYLHSGREETIKDAVVFHIDASGMKNKLNFLSKNLSYINLTSREIEYLISFLNSLNDHYE